jgi:predicted DNA-binding helix-hairpin-helix protein
LKIIPGASEAAIRQCISLASAVSLNIETPGENSFRLLSSTKNYVRDILRPIQFIADLTAKGSRFERVKHTTQFVVGASVETDQEIITASGKLYKKLGLNRIYFSAYQRGAGSPELPGETSNVANSELLMREHRLYQMDWLIRKYGFSAEEIPVEENGNLSLELDPKEMWARAHPEFFPVNLNRDDPNRLLRVPGLGQVMVDRILELRKQGLRVRSLDNLGRRTKVINKAVPYVVF